jgi:hypothetical protein
MPPNAPSLRTHTLIFDGVLGMRVSTSVVSDTDQGLIGLMGSIDRAALAVPRRRRAHLAGDDPRPQKQVPDWNQQLYFELS